MSSTTAKDLLNGDIRKTLVSMTIPMILGMIMLMTFSLVDTFFVSLLGTNELAAISFTFPVTFTIISLNIGLGIGTSAVIGRCLGSGNTEHAKVLGAGAIALSVLLVLLLVVITYFLLDEIFIAMGATETTLPLIKQYMHIWLISGVLLAVPMVGNSILRANGDTKTPSIIMAAGGAINAALDPLLIFGWGPVPALGIQGAAIATAIAWAVGSVWIIYLLAVKRGLIEAKIPNLSELRQTSKGILTIGLPAAGANMLTPISGAIMTAIVASYGETAVAAWGVGSRMESIACIIVLALSMSLPPFVSQNFGANNWQRISLAYQMCMKFVLIWQVLVFGVLMALAIPVALAFAKEQEVRDLITLFLYIVPLGYGLQGVIILTNSSLNAMHRPMAGLALSLIRLFLCYIPVAYIGSLMFDLMGLFWGCVLANLIAAIISYVWFSNELKKMQIQTESPTT